MATPHNEAKFGDFAKVVLMPGDPKRAKYIADTFLHDVVCVNTVRGMNAFTGLTKNNVRISIMPSGMGQPSIGIYSHELYSAYGVETIIRVGTCGSYQNNINLRDVILCSASSTDSNWMSQFKLNGTFSAVADWDVLTTAIHTLEEHKVPYHVGNILSADIFYDYDKDIWKRWADLGVLGVEMESYALYVNAAHLHKRALCFLTVTDSFVKIDKLTPEERQLGLNTMLEMAILTAEKFA